MHAFSPSFLLHNRRKTLCRHQTIRLQNGFTLIELLVVIAIITVLAAMLFPVFARVRENARRTACLSSLQQIGLGLLQYMQDNDERNTRQWYGSSGDSNATTSYKWMDAIFPYVKSEKVFNCPSHSLPAVVGIRTYDKYKFREGRKWGSYAINATYYDIDLDPDPVGERYLNPFQSPKHSTWEAPATTIYAMDGAGRFEFAWPSANPDIGAGTPRNLGGIHAIQERHLETVNALFCDGHVKAQKLEKFMSVGTSGYYSQFTVQADPD